MPGPMVFVKKSDATESMFRVLSTLPKVSEPQPRCLEINCRQSNGFLEENACRGRVVQRFLSKKHWFDVSLCPKENGTVT